MMAKRKTSFDPVRVGIVGLGAFGRVHALTAAGVVEADLVALVDSDERRFADVPAELADVPRWHDLHHALNESDAEAWIVATSTAAHVPLTNMLLAAGKSVLLEKPIAEDLETAEKLVLPSDAESNRLMLGHVVLFNSEFRELLQQVRQRGPIAYIDCVRHRPASTLDAFPNESPFHLTMVHDLYLVLVVMDGREPARVSAQTHRTADGRCDLALAQLQWENGAVASLCASFLTPPGMASDGFDRMEVFGQGWAARIRPNPRPIELWDTRARWPLALEIQAQPHATSGMLAEQLRCFCRVVRGIEPVPRGATYHDGLQVQRWTQRLVEASGIAPR